MSVSQAASAGEQALKRSYQGGRLAAVVAANKIDLDRGFSVARETFVRNEVAAAVSKGLPDVARRWLIWSEVMRAMDEEDARNYKANGCCILAFTWLQRLLSFFELGFRLMWHGFFAGFWGALAACRKEDPNVLANVGFHGLAISAYMAAAGAIMHDLGTPSKPARATACGCGPDARKKRLDRPTPPLAAGERIKPEDPEDMIRPRGLAQNLVFTLQSKHPLEHIERLWAGMFCTMSCFRACHPSATCGPCCSCCRPCYDTLPQRIARWNDDIQKKERDPVLQAFYLRKFNVNSYEEYIQKRLSEMATTAPESAFMQRGANIQDLEEGLALGLLESFVGHGPPRGGTASEPARAALGVFKGMVGIAPREGGDVEAAGAERGAAMSAPVMQMMAIIQSVVGDLGSQAQTRGTNAAQQLQHLKEHTEEESKGAFAL